MRADRLISLLMLLQSRGRMNARELAIALEVSERTIYWDVEALGTAGIPIYAEAGPSGGYALLEGYRTTLTGLTRDEVRALFMVSIPAPLADLGVDQELRNALFKLSAALPNTRRQEEERVHQRFHLDFTGWQQDAGAVPHLQTLQQAVWHDQRLLIHYQLPMQIPIEHLIDAYGLVAKAGIWYLVCAHNGRMCVHRVSDLRTVQIRDEQFTRSHDFDLCSFWQAWCTEQEQNRSLYMVTMRVAPSLLPLLPTMAGGGTCAHVAADPPDGAIWVTRTLCFASLEAARDRLLTFGGAVEVLSPRALRLSIADYATQIATLYSHV